VPGRKWDTIWNASRVDGRECGMIYFVGFGLSLVSNNNNNNNKPLILKKAIVQYAV
jgi:hypothetical protein